MHEINEAAAGRAAGRRRARVSPALREDFAPALRFYLAHGGNGEPTEMLSQSLALYLIGSPQRPGSDAHIIDRAGRLIAFILELLDDPPGAAATSPAHDLIGECTKVLRRMEIGAQ